jgi:hypothetical protein
MAGTQPLGRLAPTHLWTPGLGDPTGLASPPRTRLGAVSAASALALSLQPRAERVRAFGLASRLRRRPHAAVWPGEEPGDPIEDTPIIDRDAEFVEFVLADVQRRRDAEDAFYANLDPDTGELP